MADLTTKISARIQEKGPLTFKEFMEMALYDPEGGYYCSPGEKIGFQGDFYTAPEVHPLFGAMLARQFAQVWELLGKPPQWYLVEYGGGKGTLARDILQTLKREYPGAWRAVHYRLIEVSPVMRERQKDTLAGLPSEKLSWAEKLSPTPERGIRQGVVFANEFVDALPVHRVRQTAQGLKELYINWRDGSFVEEEGALSDPRIEEHLDAAGVKLLPGQTAEVNLAAREWLREVSSWLQKGFLLVIDYGVRAEELYHPTRFAGTLRCYRRHRLSTDALHAPGSQDITSHVDFSALMRWGEEEGFFVAGYTTQGNFLLNLGILEALPRPAREFTYDAAFLRAATAVKNLVLPEGMGQAFKVLVLGKGMEKAALTGFKKRSLEP